MVTGNTRMAGTRRELGDYLERLKLNDPCLMRVYHFNRPAGHWGVYEGHEGDSIKIVDGLGHIRRTIIAPNDMRFIFSGIEIRRLSSHKTEMIKRGTPEHEKLHGMMENVGYIDVTGF
jgi:hypothetical protein